MLYGEGGTLVVGQPGEGEAKKANVRGKKRTGLVEGGLRRGRWVYD